MRSVRNEDRFTVFGGSEVESSIRHLVETVRTEIGAKVPRNHLVALVLLGGYGRGEGGVEVRGGREQPHNNLDFLILTRGRSRRRIKALKQELDESLAPISREWGVGLDLGVMPASQLRQAPSLVMWYDLRHGHKTLLGDASFVPSLNHLRADRIPADDVRNLLVNRGSLLLINDVLAEQGRDLKHARTVVKHTIKAILGYGDAYLFHRGLYHWSYREKQARFRKLENVDTRFQKLYEEAMQFRFRPEYDRFMAIDLHSWLADLRPRLESIHLWTESRRLAAAELNWPDYPQLYLRRCLTDLISHPARLAHRLSRRTGAGSDRTLDITARIAFRAASSRDLIALTFPTLAYRPDCHELRELARSCLGSLGGQPSGLQAMELQKAYLRVWGLHGDPNFRTVAEKLGLELEEEELAA